MAHLSQLWLTTKLRQGYACFVPWLPSLNLTLLATVSNITFIKCLPVYQAARKKKQLHDVQFHMTSPASAHVPIDGKETKATSECDHRQTRS